MAFYVKERSGARNSGRKPGPAGGRIRVRLSRRRGAADLRRAVRRCPIRHILVRHEAGAAHAAEGYARSTGKPGVVLVTSGPGATNAVTGIADAFMDSIPLVVITGQVPPA
jgi:thiamine pyrophosphate-dependent acetolactate synthase large subunit-like protein